MVNVITKLPNKSTLFVGLGLQKCTYEMSVKLEDQGVYKKQGSAKGV